MLYKNLPYVVYLIVYRMKAVDIQFIIYEYIYATSLVGELIY